MSLPPSLVITITTSCVLVMTCCGNDIFNFFQEKKMLGHGFANITQQLVQKT